MILGIGVDIIEIERISKAVNRNKRFLEKVLDKKEIEYLQSRNMRMEYIAGRFAAKEAVSKALGTGFKNFGPKDICIFNSESGKPNAILKGNAKTYAENFGKYKIHLSISHSYKDAIAYAILERC